MLKIGKGLKKKKKSKKHKKGEDELFKPEELEQYRRDHQARTEAEYTEEVVVEENAVAGSAPTKAVDNDEWKKFNALTSGVDNILKKTQGDLERIKSTSFFKKVPPPKPTPPPVKVKPENQESEQTKPSETADATLPELTPHFIEEESESEYEEEEDIFDTSYVDVVASGEIKLAYVPDSPTDADDQADFDPFDTSAAEKIIRGPEVSKKGKKIVSIGSAVEVLTGRIENVSTCAVGRKSPRRIQGNTDLLLDTEAVEVDTNGNLTVDLTIKEEKVEKSLLDDDDFIPSEEPIDLSVSLVQNKVTVTESSENQVEKSDSGFDLKEFDVLTAKNDEPDELDDEFANLAAESLKTVKPQLDPEQVKSQTQATVASETAWDAFGNDVNAQLNENEDFANFTPERKSSSVSIHVTDPSGQDEAVKNDFPDDFESEISLLKPAHRDLLGGSTTDLSKLANQPLAPTEIKPEEDLSSYSDPFDTSVVDQINIPGKTELKFIEAELLGDSEPKEGFQKNQNQLRKSLSDPDFDPRKDEVVQPVTETQFELEEDNKDPFDTSFIATVVPGKAELKLIESELAELEETVVPSGSNKLEQILNKNISPPKDLPLTQPEKEATDLLFVEENVNIKALTPAVEKPVVSEFDSYSDPFDTSSACNILPGKAELKLLENELLTIQSPVAVKPAREAIASVLPTAFAPPVQEGVAKTSNVVDDLLADIPDDNNLEFKALTPKKETSSLELDDDFDPFDTSITTNLVPGKVELKLLESELIQ